MQTGGWSRTFLDPAALMRLSAVPLLSRSAMQGTVSGRHPSPHRGSSVEFAEYRKYVPGDDLRRVDWRAYGRSERHYVKEFEADTNLRCCLVVDTSGSMGFGSDGGTKMEYARRLAGALAYLAVQQGDAVGLACVAAGKVADIPARRNPAHLSIVFDVLESTQAEGETQLIPILHELAESNRQRALMIVISDCFLPPDELKGCFEHLRFRKHDVALFQLLDPAELAFNFQRPMRFLDMEGGAAIFTDPTDIAERYHEALREHVTALNEMVLESSVDFHRATITDDYEQVLSDFLVRRHQQKGGR